MRLVAESAESHGAWIVALKWLEGGCKGPPPRGDPRMYPGGIPPRALTSFEWARISSNYGMLDLPFSKLSKLVHLLQEKRTLGVTQAFSREYLLYTTFCCEQYAYQTAASDLDQRLSGIEHAIEACDGLNFRQTMEQLCLVGYGKINSLPFRQQMELYERESEFVALRLLQASLGAFVCLKLESKGSEGFLKRMHPFWRQHRGVYRIAVAQCRDQRIRTLTVLMKLVRRQRPVVKLVEYLQREQELESRHRDFQKERDTIEEKKRLDALPRAERRKEMTRIEREKREAAEAAKNALGLTKSTSADTSETMANPLAGSFTTPEKPQAPGRPPLSVTIPAAEDETPMTDKEKKAAEKAAKKQKKAADKAAKKAEKEAKKNGGKVDPGAGGAAATLAAPVAAPRPGGSGLEVEGITSLKQGNAHEAALDLLSGDQDQLAMLDDLESLGDGLGALGSPTESVGVIDEV